MVLGAVVDELVEDDNGLLELEEDDLLEVVLD